MVEGTRSSEMDSIETSSAGSDVIPVDSRKAPGKALEVEVKWSGMTSVAVTLARTSHHKLAPPAGKSYCTVGITRKKLPVSRTL